MSLRYEKIIAPCTHGNPPACSLACPFSLDIRDVIQRCGQNRIDAAYRMLEEVVLFPDVVAALCPKPCESACLRKEIDTSIRIREVERFICQHAKRRPARSYNLPAKSGNVAVIGADFDGLAVALRLAQRRYQVTVYTPDAHIGGPLYDFLSENEFLPNIEDHFAVTDCHFTFNWEPGSFPPADAVFVCARLKDSIPLSPEVFSGTEETPVLALAEGIKNANKIDGFLKTGIIASDVRDHELKNIPDPASFRNIAAPELQNEVFTEEGLRIETERCALCDCDSCYRHCALMRFYRRFPKPLMRDVSMTVTPTDLVQKHVAMRLVASCSQCGSCVYRCPLDLDVRALIMDARRALVRRNDMPPVFRAFWLADMMHADAKGISRLSPSHNKAQYAFFPGCQLGASDPRYVSETYYRILTSEPDCALMLTCCGAPVYWAGHEDEHAEKVLRLKTDWEQLGKPALITACPTCVEMLKKALPDARTISLYSLSLGKFQTYGAGRTISVFDPCAGRHDMVSQNAIRLMLRDADYKLDSLSLERTDAPCCGWGGQYKIANPELSQEVSTFCETLSEYPYVTWCANCRDTFAADGKQAWHILDLLLGINEQLREPPTISQRRNNREVLLSMLLSKIWGEATMPQQKHSASIRMDDALAQKISDSWILETDIEQTIVECESSGMKFNDERKGTYTGCRHFKTTTLWVEYRPEGNGYRLINAYTHRMNIQENQ